MYPAIKSRSACMSGTQQTELAHRRMLGNVCSFHKRCYMRMPTRCDCCHVPIVLPHAWTYSNQAGSRSAVSCGNVQLLAWTSQPPIDLRMLLLQAVICEGQGRSPSHWRLSPIAEAKLFPAVKRQMTCWQKLTCDHISSCKFVWCCQTKVAQIGVTLYMHQHFFV